MKFCRSSVLLLLFFSILLVGCIESYPPPVIDDQVDFLVIDGSVNSTDSTARIKLSHAIALSSTEPVTPELGATVRVEDNDGNSYQINETRDGIYQQANLPINITKQYRLYVKTSDNVEYQSDFISIKKTPPIDSITWAPSQSMDGINIMVNAHDDLKETRYYQWTFEETYQYEAPFSSSLRIDNGALVVIPYEERTFVCWRTLPSTRILIASSDRLNQDVIYNFPINFIPKGSQKVLIRYSILVKQMALSRQAYDYWLNLQKTTENLGGLFDPQPGRITGNIHNMTNPTDPVLGYFSAGASQQTRIFIDRQDLPKEIKTYKLIDGCTMDTVLFAKDPLAHPDNILNTVEQMTTVIGYIYSTAPCVDCRFQGGVTTKPLFWE